MIIAITFGQLFAAIFISALLGFFVGASVAFSIRERVK